MRTKPKEQKFLRAIEDLFVGAKIDGESGFVNLMRTKNTYFQSIRAELLKRVDERTSGNESFREELFDKLYTFFHRYFCESGSIYFRHLPAFGKTYDRVYEEGRDVSLAWKTRPLYYVKSDVLIQSMPIEIASRQNPRTKLQFYFDASSLEHKKHNELKELLYEFKKIEVANGNRTAHLSVTYANGGRKTKIDAILSSVRKDASGYILHPGDLQHAICVFQRQTEVDFFINKDADHFLKEQFDLWMFQYLYGEEHEFSHDRVSQLKALKNTAYDIIAFIAQFEDELRRVWEKPKFVRNANYVLTLDRLQKSLIQKIAAHQGFEKQLLEWQELGLVEGEFTADSLLNSATLGFGNGLSDKHSFLPLDTAHFADLKHEILDQLGNLDAAVSGELVCSDNWQALNTLRKRFAGRVDCIHIDPPYNTSTSGFLYKNEFRHASWLTMMDNRIAFTQELLQDDGSFLCHIDEHEYERLHLLLEDTDLLNVGTIVWDKRNPVSGRKGIANQHEYVIWRSKAERFLTLESDNLRAIQEMARSLISEHGGVGDEVRRKFSRWVDSQSEFSGGDKAYKLIDEDGRIYRTVSLSAPEPRTGPKFHVPLIHPVTGKPCPVPANGFSRTPETLQAMVDKGEIIFGTDETTQPQQKRFLNHNAEKMIASVIQNAKKGKADLDRLGLTNFPYCHSVDFYSDLIKSATNSKDGLVLDYFAGSGTTGHSVININRCDGGNRKYLLMEAGEYFYSVLIPRLKKVIFSQEWRKGKPVSEFGSSHMFKYYRLEQYEESLKNMRYKNVEQLELDSRKSPFEQYVFFSDEKFSQAVNLADGDSIDINLGDLYDDIDIAESLSNILGKPIRSVDADRVTFADGSSERINTEKMNGEEKLRFISLIKPYIWWGA